MGASGVVAVLVGAWWWILRGDIREPNCFCPPPSPRLPFFPAPCPCPPALSLTLTSSALERFRCVLRSLSAATTAVAAVAVNKPRVERADTPTHTHTPKALTTAALGGGARTSHHKIASSTRRGARTLRVHVPNSAFCGLRLSVLLPASRSHADAHVQAVTDKGVSKPCHRWVTRQEQGGWMWTTAAAREGPKAAAGAAKAAGTAATTKSWRNLSP
ncbi:unnamed protein product [Scytosiphon promiscuus]